MDRETKLRIGIDLGGTKIEGAVITPKNRIVMRRRVATPAGNAEATIAAVRDLVLSLETEIGGPARTGRASVGICTPGSPSPQDGRLRNSNSTCLNGLPLEKLLTDALQRPVRIANDADCLALSEATDGAAARCSPVFGVILGTGVGGGLIVDGKLVRGPHGITGEWGHNSVPWSRDDERPGPLCYCGRRGCIETYLSGPALARDHLLHSGQALTPEEVFARADGGDRDAKASLARYLDRLARSISAMINLIDPEVVVLGGGLSNAEVLYAEIPRLWTTWVFSDVVMTKFVKAQHGDSSGVRGAAWLWNHP